MITAFSGASDLPSAAECADDAFDDVQHAFAGFGAGANRILGGNADDVFDLRGHPIGVGGRQVDLVQDRHHLDALLDRGVAVRHGLRFHALRSIHHQQRTFARRQRARHFVREIDVPRRVDQVEQVGLTIARTVAQCHGLRFDRDAALALEIHRVEHLGFHLPVAQAAAHLDEAVSQCGLAVVDVGDDGKVADVLHHKKGHSRVPRYPVASVVR